METPTFTGSATIFSSKEIKQPVSGGQCPFKVAGSRQSADGSRIQESCWLKSRESEGMSLTKEEKEFIGRNVSFGYATKDDLPSLEENETIPWMAVPNMPLPNGQIKKFSKEEVFEAVFGKEESK